MPSYRKNRSSRSYSSGAASVKIDDEHFWSRVDHNGPILRRSLGRCWMWLGERHNRTIGYGRVQRRKKRYLAHRWAWFLAHGKHARPCALHKCDNTMCVRPSHLFEGTKADNNFDKVAKDRQARGEVIGRRVQGELHSLSRATTRLVMQIRQQVANGRLQKDIAQEVGLSRQIISNIVCGRRWRHVAGPIKQSRQTRGGRRR